MNIDLDVLENKMKITDQWKVGAKYHDPWRNVVTKHVNKRKPYTLYQCELDTGKITKYASMYEAAIKMRCQKSSISRAVSSKMAYIGKYIYAKSLEEIEELKKTVIITKIGYRKPIKILDMEDGSELSYDTVTIASKMLGCSRSTIKKDKIIKKRYRIL